MKVFKKNLTWNLLIIFSICVFLDFISIPQEKCVKQQKEIGYNLKPIFLNDSTINNVDISLTPIPWPKIVIAPSNFSENLNFVLIVHSAIENFERRNILRQQFSVNHQKMFKFRIIFAIGRSEIDQIQKQSKKEAVIFGDILLNYSIDFYKHLTIKAVSWIKFISQYWSNLNYIVKIDDDVSVNFEMLLQFLNQQSDKKHSLFCSPMKQIADRRKDSKWHLSYNEFRYRNLGIFCAGLAYIFTSDLLPLMQENIETRRFVWLDDWYVTHALLNNVDFTLYNTDDLYFTSEKSSMAFRKLRQIMTFQKPIPIFTHLRPRTFLDTKKQKQLWKFSQPCKK